MSGVNRQRGFYNARNQYPETKYPDPNHNNGTNNTSLNTNNRPATPRNYNENWRASSANVIEVGNAEN